MIFSHVVGVISVIIRHISVVYQVRVGESAFSSIEINTRVGECSRRINL